MSKSYISLDAPQSRPGRIVAPISDSENDDFIPVRPRTQPSRHSVEPDSPQYDDDIEPMMDVDRADPMRVTPPSGIPTEPLPSLAQAMMQFKQRVQLKKEELAERHDQAEAERREMERLRIDLSAIKGEIEAARQRVRTLETTIYQQETQT